MYLIEVIQLFCCPVAIRVFENAVQATNAGKTQVADRQTGNLRRHVSMMLAADLLDVINSVDSADHFLHCEICILEALNFLVEQDWHVVNSDFVWQRVWRKDSQIDLVGLPLADRDVHEAVFAQAAEHGFQQSRNTVRLRVICSI